MSQKLKQEQKIRVPEDELEIISHSLGGYMFYHYKGKPFSGYLVMDFFPDGKIMYEEEFKDGYHMGWDNEYYENGRLKASRLMLGATTLRWYEYDKDGNLTFSGGEKSVPESTYLEFVREHKLLD